MLSQEISNSTNDESKTELYGNLSARSLGESALPECLRWLASKREKGCIFREFAFRLHEMFTKLDRKWGAFGKDVSQRVSNFSSSLSNFRLKKCMPLQTKKDPLGLDNKGKFR